MNTDQELVMHLESSAAEPDFEKQLTAVEQAQEKRRPVDSDTAVERSNIANSMAMEL